MSNITSMNITDFANIHVQGLSKSVLLLDVRTPAEYHEEHLDGAINIPEERLHEHLEDVHG